MELAEESTENTFTLQFNQLPGAVFHGRTNVERFKKVVQIK